MGTQTLVAVQHADRTRRPRRRSAVAARIAGLAAAIVALALLGATPARADRDYSVRFTTNAQGDITGTGNTLMTCRATDAACANAQSGIGTTLNNNNLFMRYVDVDGDPNTFNSSAATLALPPGARVLFAGLYYGGRLQAGTGGSPAPDPNQRDTVLFRPPNLGAYVTLHASQVDDTPLTGALTFRQYQGFVDVTNLVAAAGSGEYMVGNVQLGTGLDADQDGGWALAVAYEDTNLPTRNLTIFDGFRFVLADGPPVDIPLSGFLTPKTGPVATKIGLVALEGDLGTTGDSATLNANTPTPDVLSNPANPATNFFNASISSRDGTFFQQKRPNYRNQLGFDADIFDATGLLDNGQTATTLRLATSGDGFAPNGVSFATDLFAPAMHITKQVAPEGPVPAGTRLTYTIGVQNTGLDGAANVVLRDEIPDGTRFVPGSIRVVAGANAGPKTDGAGDDQGELDPSDAVVVRLGDGATADAGGHLAQDQSTIISFQVEVTDPLPPGFVVQNSATVGFVGDTLGQPGSVSSPDVVTPVIVPDLAIQKSHTGDLVAGRTAPFTLEVRNVGDASATGLTTVTDTLPPELSFAEQPSGTGWSCSTSGRALTCTRSDALAPGAAFPPIRYTARVAQGATPSTIRNTARVSNPHDGNELNDEDTDEGAIRHPNVDLAIDKIALTPVGFPGRPVRFLLRFTNKGIDTATGVVVRDVLPRGLTPVSAVPSQGTCAGTVCRIGRLRPGQTETIRLTAVAGLDTGGRILRDVALIHGRQRDLDPADNVDAARVRIIALVDLVVDKSATSTSAVPGGNVEYLVTVRNAGPSRATGVVMRDLLPAGLTGVSATPSQGACPTPSLCSLGIIARGETVQIVLVAHADPSVPVGATLTNTVAALARQVDVNLANNLARASVTFDANVPPGPADVVVTKTANASVVNVGGRLTYTITAHNRGPQTAAAVVVTDTPNANERPVSATPSQGTCTLGLEIRCELGAIPSGASATVTVVVEATAAGPLRNAASALTPTPTVRPPDEIDVAGEIARSAPVVRLRKRASRSSVTPGGHVAFSLTATNAGRGTARGVRVCDRIPRAFDVVDPGGATRQADGRWCWTIARLADGASRTLRIAVRARSVSTATRVVNVATLTAGDRAPRIARAAVRIVPPGARLTG
jgi:uncharacterized repeat protein (TIGR01451 family)